MAQIEYHTKDVRDYYYATLIFLFHNERTNVLELYLADDGTTYNFEVFENSAALFKYYCQALPESDQIHLCCHLPVLAHSFISNNEVVVLFPMSHWHTC